MWYLGVTDDHEGERSDYADCRLSYPRFLGSLGESVRRSIIATLTGVATIASLHVVRRSDAREPTMPD